MTKKLKPEIHKISELVDSFKDGSLSIPEFQREYVWKSVKIGKLLDSLYHSLPISALLVWESGNFLNKTSTFWEIRRQLLSDAFNEYVKSKLPGRRL